VHRIEPAQFRSLETDLVPISSQLHRALLHLDLSGRACSAAKNVIVTLSMKKSQEGNL
jgi:hypothetical protein